MNKTWFENFLNEVNLIDLSLPCLTQKRLDKGDTIIGELSEYLQKLYRFREEHRESVEFFRDSIDDIKNVHTTEHRLEINTPEGCAQHIIKIKHNFDIFKARLALYITVDHLFKNEIETAFPFETELFSVIGIRDGKTLVGRDDNIRADQDSLTEYFTQIQMALNLQDLIKNC